MDAGPLRVLLIDDSDTYDMIVRSLLPTDRYVVHRVGSPTAARAALARAEHDVYLVDYKLPGVRGTDLIREAVANGCTAPLLLLTGAGDREVDLEALEAGAADYLDKGKLGAESLDRALRYAIERKRNSAALLRLEKAVETMQIGVCVTDLSGRVIYANAAEAGMHGYSVDELMGHAGRELSPREDWRPMSAADLNRIQRWKRERVRMRKDGSTFPVQLLSDVVRDDGGRPVGMVTTCEDITERKLAEKALRESEQRYRNLVEAAPDVIFTLSPDGLFTSMNTSFARISGWSTDDWLGRGFIRMLHPDDVGAASETFRRLLAGERSTVSESRVLKADGEWLTAEVTSSPQWREGQVVGVLCIARDVTSRKHADERQALQLAVTRVLAEFTTVAAAAPPLLSTLCSRTGWDAGLLWMAEGERGVRLCETWRDDGLLTPALDLAGSTSALAADSGPAARAWGTGDPAWISDLAREDAAYPASSDGLRGACAVPIVSGAEKLGVIELYSRKPRSVDAALLLLLQDVGRQLGLFTERARAQDALRESESRFRSVTQSTLDAIVSTDASGSILFWNQAAERTFGYKADEVIGQPLTLLMPGRHRAVLQAALASLAPGEPARLLGRVVQFEALRRNGTEFPAEMSLSTWNSSDALCYAAIVRDVTERRRAEEALRESAERYALAVRGTNDGIWDWDLKANRIYLSPRWKEILGYAEEDLGDSPNEWLDRVHADDRRRVDDKIAAHVAGDTVFFEDEHRVRHRDGSYRWVLCRGHAVTDPDGTPHRMAGAQTDVSDRRAYDPLTGLPNRVLFAEKVEGALTRARIQRDATFAVLFVDLDGFKKVNDTLGHLAGDQLLIGMARRLESCLRPGDVVARFGGDEFAILLQRLVGTADATRVASRVLRTLADPMDLGGQPVALSGSVGIAFSTPALEAVDTLLSEADTAMYRAKALGKGRYEVFDDAMRARLTARNVLERDLEGAASRKEMVVLYQPVVSLTTGALEGFEALVRWNSPDRGLLAPHEFLEVAEDTGAILSIGSVVWMEACRRIAAWSGDDRAPWVSVNVSSRQFLDKGLLTEIDGALAATGADARRLRIELSERSMTALGPAERGALAQLQRRGIEVHLDDFGSGDASLRHLHALALDGIKLDGSVLADPTDPKAAAYLRALLAVAVAEGLQVSAEAVETEEQRDRLLELGCTHGQGFLYAAALTEEEAQRWVVAGSTKPESVVRAN